jgi:hypothetical protein
LHALQYRRYGPGLWRDRLRDADDRAQPFDSPSAPKAEPRFAEHDRRLTREQFGKGPVEDDGRCLRSDQRANVDAERGARASDASAEIFSNSSERWFLGRGKS